MSDHSCKTPKMWTEVNFTCEQPVNVSFTPKIFYCKTITKYAKLLQLGTGLSIMYRYGLLISEMGRFVEKFINRLE